ncbi:hypothetical protein [Cupriavidus pinatubonensis]|uniref:hypothetical protein n=1 Tax=Cupriavidus pinatubonensis TaxID=248026 RepID=UPI0036153EF9
MVQEKQFDYVLRRLHETRGRWPDAAAGSGVPISTIRKIAQRQIADPAVSKVQALADYFHRLDEFNAKNAARVPEPVAA